MAQYGHQIKFLCEAVRWVVLRENSYLHLQQSLLFGCGHTSIYEYDVHFVVHMFCDIAVCLQTMHTWCPFARQSKDTRP